MVSWTSRAKRRRKQAFRHRTPPGTAPGLPVSDGGPSSAKIRAFRWTREELSETEPASVAELRPLLSDDHFLWVDLDEVTGVDVVRQVGEIFGLHPLSLEDVIHVHQRSKVEEYESYHYIVLRMVSPGEGFQTEQVSLFLGDRWLVTFQSVPGDCLGDVRNRIRDPASLIRRSGVDFLAYRVIDAIVDAYFPLLERIDGRLSAIEDAIDAGEGETAIRDLHRIRRDVHDIRRALWPQREAVGSLTRGAVRRIRPETIVFLRDCADHTMQLMDVLDSLRDTCGELRDLHLSQLSQRTNETTRLLSTIATLFLPVTFVAGLYGMNFDPAVSDWNMPELKWAMGYPFALGLMLLLEIGLIVFLRRRG